MKTLTKFLNISIVAISLIGICWFCFGNTSSEKKTNQEKASSSRHYDISLHLFHTLL